MAEEQPQPNIKSTEDVIKRIKEILSMAGLSHIVYSIVRNNYLQGWDEAEKSMNKNFLPEQHAIDFLNTYTFDMIKGMNDDLLNKLRQELSRGYMEGEGIAKIKKRIASVFEVGKVRAEMIARTETNRASNFGRLHAYQKAGEKGNKIYITRFDVRTSALCKRLDGQIVDLNENFKDPNGEWSGLAPPAHVNCRSSFAFIPEE